VLTLTPPPDGDPVLELTVIGLVDTELTLEVKSR
jgi:hypothetical protein